MLFHLSFCLLLPYVLHPPPRLPWLFCSFSFPPSSFLPPFPSYSVFNTAPRSLWGFPLPLPDPLEVSLRGFLVGSPPYRLKASCPSGQNCDRALEPRHGKGGYSRGEREQREIEKGRSSRRNKGEEFGGKRSQRRRATASDWRDSNYAYGG